MSFSGHGLLFYIAFPNGASVTDNSQQRTGFGVVAVICREERLLLIRRSQIVTAPGYVCFAGGGVEDGESEEEALVREMHEELGVEVQPARRIWQSTTRWGTRLGWWLADLDIAQQITPNPEEVAEIFWLTPDEIAAREDLLGSMPDFLAAWKSNEFALPLR